MTDSTTTTTNTDASTTGPVETPATETPAAEVTTTEVVEQTATTDAAPAKKTYTAEETEAYIKRLRDEAKTNREDASSAKSIVEAISKALNPEAPAEEKPDAESLAKTLADTQTTARTATAELAVYKAANAAGANVDALLDSRSFMSKVDSLDPASETFQKDLSDAITTALEANSAFKSQKVPSASTPDLPAGSGTETEITGGDPIDAELKAISRH